MTEKKEIALFIDLKRKQRNMLYEVSVEEGGEAVSGGLEKVVEKMQLEEEKESEVKTDNEDK